MLGLALTLATALPAVGLNHIYVVLDQATYDALVNSDFVMDELASSDGGINHPTRPGPGSRSVYLRGRNTYIELLAPRNPTAAPVDSCGLALSPDEDGALDTLERSLRRVAPQTRRRVVTLDVGEHPIPWYDVLAVDVPAEPRLSWWLSQYHPEFVKQVLHATSVDRRTYLSRLFRPEGLLEDVVEVTLALTASESGPLRAQLRALGFREKQTAEGVLLDGSGLKLRILSQARAVGPAIISATLALRRPLRRDVEVGATRFNAEGLRAVWRFAPDPVRGSAH
ncbi:MAG: hypothetical protein JWM53_1479 [bacterium]|nr:hypothetical protein [bacterium]